MARFSFGKRSHEDEGIPPEPVEGDADLSLSDEVEESGGGRLRRPLILLGIGVLLVGGYYLASQLFFASPTSAPPSPPPMKAPEKVQAPQPPAPTSPPAPAKAAEAKPAAPTARVEGGTKAKPAPTSPPAPAKAAEAKPAAPTAKGGFSIQVGAMAVEENAENLKRKLDAAGFATTIRKGSGFLSRHLVTVGETTGKREAEELARRLNVDGFPSQILAVEGKYTPQIGTFINLDEAIDLARELQKKNYPPKITSRQATTVLHQVRHGQFDSRAAAMKRSEELKSKGFSAFVVAN
jgi:cell division septation protein DedD